MLYVDFSHVVSLGARLYGDPVAVHGGHPVEEDEDADHRGREQPARVEAKPGEVDRDLRTGSKNIISCICQTRN